ncbi:MAG TPA: hypothetical protein ENH75_09215 [archaeon]|nr:hypothetical protein [archaeon]
MTAQKDLLSSLTKGFPKGTKINKTIPIAPDLLDNVHNRLREATEEKGYKYHDVINELKVIENDGYALIKVALHRNAILLSAESKDKTHAQKLINDLEEMISKL